MVGMSVSEVHAKRVTIMPKDLLRRRGGIILLGVTMFC